MRRLGQKIGSLTLVVGGVLGVCVGSWGTQDPADKPTDAATGVVANRASKTFHRPDCPLTARLTAKTKQAFDSPQEAEKAGFRACPQCKPGAADDENSGKNKGKASKKAPSAKPKTATPTDEALRFSRDIAPIFAANCNGCHNAQMKRGEFVITTFESLKKGSKSGEVIVPGKPEESLLVQLVETRKMPRGGNRRLSDQAIAKIRDWVRQGALLDPGVSATAPLDQIAPSQEELRKEALARLSVDEVDSKLKQTGLDRWKKATTKSEPLVTEGRNFLLFSNLPEARTAALLKSLENERTLLANFFGSEGNALGGPEKISVYVFNNSNVYAEFLRAVEQREVELGVEAHARLGVEAPYLVAIDPLGGAAEATAKGRGSKKKEADNALLAPTRSLPALLAEAFGTGIVQAAGKPPRWLAEGFGAYVASLLEPRSSYMAKLRNEAADQLQIGGATRLTEALGDQASPEALRALGFSLCEWMAAGARQAFPEFVRGMTQEGTAKLDEVIKACFGPETNRDDLLEQWAEFIATRYGTPRRR